MAMSVKRRIERNLSNVMGQRDPEVMIRVRSTDSIRASGLVPRQQAGHMTASDRTRQNAKKTLASRGPSTHDVERPVMTGRTVVTMRGRCYRGEDSDRAESAVMTFCGPGDDV